MHDPQLHKAKCELPTSCNRSPIKTKRLIKYQLVYLHQALFCLLSCISKEIALLINFIFVSFSVKKTLSSLIPIPIPIPIPHRCPWFLVLLLSSSSCSSSSAAVSVPAAAYTRRAASHNVSSPSLISHTNVCCCCCC